MNVVYHTGVILVSDHPTPSSCNCQTEQGKSWVTVPDVDVIIFLLTEALLPIPVLAFIYVSIFHVIITGLHCLSMLPSLLSCKVLAFVVFCKFVTAFIYKKSSPSMKGSKG